ncbi:Protein CBG27148 [Caenorhabditis briggsae]|uniref:Protein CBG27148 n=1 Tax=Caenorhabditis briggsae TaxID=6238 RepID=B6IL58_CAEBR|nr:Protein CBG27148 [Caenorhabditis briggsae]CAS00611.1 Protein CBG27148 [Caenorhabditis briggsae]
MVEQLTSLEDVVLQKSVEKILAEDSNATTGDFFYLGIFRVIFSLSEKSNLFYGFLSLVNFYWLSYGFLAFKYYREEFDKFIAMYRGFYMKSLLMIIYAVFLIFMIYNSFYIAQWVEYYKNRCNGRQERFEKFLEEYEGVVNSTSLRSSCSMEEASTEWDEIKAFHLKIQGHYYQNVPTSEKTLSIMLNVSELVQRDCRNETAPICRNENSEQQINNWTVIENLKVITYFQKNIKKYFFIQAWNSSELLINWDNLTSPFENAKTEVFHHQTTNFHDIQEAARERMMLLKNFYGKIEALFHLQLVLNTSGFLQDFLKSTDHTVIEELLALNPQAICEFKMLTMCIPQYSSGKINLSVRNNTRSISQINDWKHKIEIILENNTSFYTSPVKEFCENTGQLINENNGSWIDMLKKELHHITRLCKSIEGEYFFCQFKRSGNDLEGLLLLHQKYRLGMWNDYVAPITFLEVPSINALICFFAMSTMIMISISMVETEDPTPTPENRFEYYKLHTAD